VKSLFHKNTMFLFCHATHVEHEDVNNWFTIVFFKKISVSTSIFAILSRSFVRFGLSGRSFVAVKNFWVLIGDLSS
jgi:hypothetical protein